MCITPYSFKYMKENKAAKLASMPNSVDWHQDKLLFSQIVVTLEGTNLFLFYNLFYNFS